MNIVLWIGNEPNQKAFANKLHTLFPISAIVTETRQSKTKYSIRQIFEKAFEKIFLPSIGKSWWNMLKHYNKEFPNYPETEILNVENINSQIVYEFTNKHKPDLILVSGTRIVKEKMISINTSIGILNLHTGLSPYVKGGPNCTNWCLANGSFHLIGNTIMWIDKGIDSGNILTTEFTMFKGNENLFELHLKVMEHAHDLYLKSIKFLASGNKKSIPQSSITDGITFYTKQWTLHQKIKLIYNFSNFKKNIKNGNTTKQQQNIITIDLNQS